MNDTDLFTTFFSAWGEADTAKRKTILEACLASDCTYADPNCPTLLTGIDAVCEMLAMFTQHMPGGSARVEGEGDSHNGFSRVLVTFGKDGKAMMQGQYFGTRDGDGPFSQIIGFVGAGA